MRSGVALRSRLLSEDGERDDPLVAVGKELRGELGVESDEGYSEESDVVTDFDELLEREKTARVEDLESLVKLRKWYAKALFGAFSVWMLFVVAVVAFDGFGWKGFEQDDTVMIALLTTSTLNVIGLLLAVVRSIFPAKK